MSAAVVDTNVLIAANGRNTHASEACQLACIRRIWQLREHGIVVLDKLDMIVGEYRRHVNANGQPGVGDAFFKYIHNKKHDPAKVELVSLTPSNNQANAGVTFQEFPNDPRLAGFDISDRKFVAAARASVHNPRILNAVDTDWQRFRTALQANGVIVDELCPQHVRGR